MDSNYESLVSSEDVQSARARARSLHCARHALENSADKTLAWESRYLETPVPISADEFVTQRLENIRESIKQELKGHHRATITPRPAYRRSLNAANCELMSFREKFEEWKMTYDREIGKTKASLASMTPTLQGLGLAARFHKIAGKASETLNGTPGKGEATPCNTVASTPRTLSETNTSYHCESGSDHGMEPSLLPLNLDTDLDLLLIREEYPDFLDDEPGILSERSGKLAEVQEDIGVLTTIIEKKIFATHVSNPVREEDIKEDVVVDLFAWSEGALTTRSIKMSEDIVDECEAAVVEASTSENIPPTPPDVPKKVVVPRINYKANHGLDHQQPRPVNLRDNLINLAKQKGFTHVGTPLHEDVPIVSGERERAMALLKKMYAPSPTPTIMQTPATGEKPKDMSTAETIQPGLPVSESLVMSPKFDYRSERHDRSGELLNRNKTKGTENTHSLEEDARGAIPPDLASPLNSPKLEQQSSVVSVTIREADVNKVATISVEPTEVSGVRELVIGSYRNHSALSRKPIYEVIHLT